MVEHLRRAVPVLPPVLGPADPGALARARALEAEAAADWDREEIDARALARRYNMPAGIWLYRSGLGLNTKAIAGDATIGRCFSMHHAWALEAGRDPYLRIAYATAIAHGRRALAAPTMRHRILWQAGRLGPATGPRARAAMLGLLNEAEQHWRRRLLAATDPMDLSGWEEFLDMFTLPFVRGTSNPEVMGTLHDVRSRLLPERSVFFAAGEGSEGYAPQCVVMKDLERVRAGRIRV